MVAPRRARGTLVWIVVLWAAFYASFALVRPPLLDDADSVHAEVAREMLLRHDYVTLYANGIRYLEKAPLLYWSMAAGLKAFGAVGLDGAGGFDGCGEVAAGVCGAGAGAGVRELCAEDVSVGDGGAVCGADSAVELWDFYLHADHDSGCDGVSVDRDGAVVFLADGGDLIRSARNARSPPFRDATAHDAHPESRIRREGGAPGFVVTGLSMSRIYCWGFAASCALNVLTKGLIGVVFPVATVLIYLLLTRGWKRAVARVKALYPWSSLVVFLVIAAPWHVLAGLANPTQGHPAPFHFANGHWQVPLPTDGNVRGWFWFYFMNEHVLRYLNLRVPRDYDTVPLLVFWGLCLVWMMPWSAFGFKVAGWALPVRRRNGGASFGGMIFR